MKSKKPINQPCLSYEDVINCCWVDGCGGWPRLHEEKLMALVKNKVQDKLRIKIIQL